MTISDLTTKTDEELNILCAQACGWRFVSGDTGDPLIIGWTCLDPDGVHRRFVTAHKSVHGPSLFHETVPPYTACHNAVSKAREGLSEYEHDRFTDNLLHVLGRRDPSNSSYGEFTMSDLRAYFNAAPRQQTIALILAKQG